MMSKQADAPLKIRDGEFTYKKYIGYLPVKCGKNG